MHIRSVTLRGINDSFSISELIKLTEYYPFIEFGIFLEKRSTTISREYLEKLKDSSDGLRLLGILIKEWRDDFNSGNISIKRSRSSLWHMFNRLQVDTSGADPEKVLQIISLINKEVVLETDYVRSLHMDACTRGLNIEMVFNKSFSGIWQKPMDEVRCSYLNAVSLNKLEDELGQMSDYIGDVTVALQFDIESLKDIEYNLSIIEDYVTSPSRSEAYFETKSSSDRVRKDSMKL